MKQILVVLSLLIGFTANAQSNFTSEDDARDIMRNIISAVGLQPKFETKEASIPNAAAVIYNRKRYILYNPKFVSSLNKIAGNQWASVSILAHEIGHHLNGHTLEGGGSKPAIELEADEFSGFVLQKMGATLPEAQAAMKIAASQRASHTHPAQNNRLVAIAKGWNNARGQNGNTNSDVAKKYQKPEVTTQPVSEPIARNTRPTPVSNNLPIAEQYISKDIYFTADKSANYFVTIRNNVVKVQGNKLSVIGKLAASDSRDYPLVIHDDADFYLLVTRQGTIVTPTGKKIGFMKAH
jgi:hypothetical protein